MSRSRIRAGEGTGGRGGLRWPGLAATAMPAAMLSASAAATACRRVRVIQTVLSVPRRQFGGARYGNVAVTFGESNATLSVVSWGVA